MSIAVSRIEQILNHSESFVIREISAAEAAAGVSLTTFFYAYRFLLSNVPGIRRFAAYAEGEQQKLIGLLLLSIHKKSSSAQFLSISVRRGFRREGIGSALFQEAEASLVDDGICSLSCSIPQSKASGGAFCNLLQKQGWLSPTPRFSLYEVDLESWLSKGFTCKVLERASKFSFCDWSELSESDRQRAIEVSQTEETQSWFPISLSGNDGQTANGSRDDCLVMHQKGQMFGWLVTQQNTPECLAYTHLLVRPRYRNSPYGLYLLAKQAERHVAQGISKGSCSVYVTNRPMLNLLQRRFAEHITQSTTSFYSEKQLKN